MAMLYIIILLYYYEDGTGSYCSEKHKNTMAATMNMKPTTRDIVPYSEMGLVNQIMASPAANMRNPPMNSMILMTRSGFIFTIELLFRYCSSCRRTLR